jgi:hypothetical protein
MLVISTIYTPIFHIGKILLILNCFSSNLNRNITELVIDTLLMVNIKNNKLNIIKKLKNRRQLFDNALYNLRIAYYKNKFGYSQVLFMGSVPRINHLLAIVSWVWSRISLFFWITFRHQLQANVTYSTDITTRVKVFQLCRSTTLFSKTC